MLDIATVEYDDMLVLPPATTNYTCSLHENTWPAPMFGYYFGINNIYFAFYHKVIIQADYAVVEPNLYQCRLRGRIYKFYNGICPASYEYDHRTGWGELEDVDNTDGLTDFFKENGTEYMLGNLVSGGIVDGRAYGTAHWVGQQVYANFTGNIYPSRLKAGQTYIEGGDEHTNCLKVTQAMLMLYNATIYTDATGRIYLVNKDASSEVIINIEDRDVVSFVTKRRNQEEPKVSEIDVLAGDTTQLQKIIRQRLIGFYDGRWIIDATIDKLSKYNLKLQDKIRIKDHIYALIEVGRDYEKDEYKVKAWRLT